MENLPMSEIYPLKSSLPRRQEKGEVVGGGDENDIWHRERVM
jgi:hypothetical protein